MLINSFETCVNFKLYTYTTEQVEVTLIFTYHLYTFCMPNMESPSLKGSTHQKEIFAIWCQILALCH